ncbi:MAG: long-chain fatty acid--CoA ligase, partial [Anaerolineales bacterium]|nr:long-chain fatty acid--CoA ligase [Anaerolineales bacterium]
MAIEWLFERMTQWRVEPALIREDQVSTYGDLLDLVALWQTHLDEHGIEAGQVVALRGDYTRKACALVLALIDRGVILVPLTEAAEVHREEFFEIAEVEVVISFDENDAWAIETR